MKGFLSLLGITLIVGAFGLILLSLPERNQVTAEIPAQAAFTTTAFMAMDNSCERASLE